MPKSISDQPSPSVGQIDVTPAIIEDLSWMQSVQSDAVKALVKEDFAERLRIGIERYGHPLQTNNGRDAGVDAYQELLDSAQYLKQLHLETQSAKIRLLYFCVIGWIFDLRAWLGDAEVD